jgi:Uncharacterized protein conserved in bacteria (DUF2330)
MGVVDTENDREDEMGKLASAAACLALATAITIGAVPRADACGGCFHATTDRGTSVITDHRMVLSISTEQTVLWDQVRYSGDPTEFAWVLPVRDGARIELARGELIEALELSTATSVKGPDIACANGSPSSSGGGGGGGCGGGSSVTSLSAARDNGSSGNVDSGFTGGDGVQVVNQSVVGPYQAVTLRSKQGDALDAWLTKNGFDIPDAVVPIISAYARESFDFIALRLRPGVGVRAMQPVRVVTPGASPVLPLRMVTAGIGANVGLTLWVISEGRWHTKNFPDAVIDPAQLAWDPYTSKSNYRDLVGKTLAAGDGRGWVTEYAQPGLDRQSVSSAGYVAGVEQLYLSACRTAPALRIPCDSKGSDLPWDGGAPPDSGAPPDAGDPDAGDPDASVTDAGVDAADAAPPPPPDCFEEHPACDSFDDLEVALTGLHRSDVWITKLRAALPAAQCGSGDLVLEAAPSQAAVAPELKTDTFTDPKYDPCNGAGRPAAKDDSGCACRTTPMGELPVSALVVAAACAAVVSRLLRKRRS